MAAWVVDSRTWRHLHRCQPNEWEGHERRLAVHVTRLGVAMDKTQNRSRPRVVRIATDGDIGLNFCVMLLEIGMEGLNRLISHVVGALRERPRVRVSKEIVGPIEKV